MKENSPNPESPKDVNLKRLLSGALHGAFISTESEHGTFVPDGGGQEEEEEEEEVSKLGAGARRER